MNNSQVYFNGVPTEPDVEKLMNKYPVDVLIPNLVIAFNEVSSIIGAPVKSSRFCGVTKAWRDKLKDVYSVLLKCPRDGTFVVQSDPGKVKMSREEIIKSAHAAKKSYEISGMVNVRQLTEQQLKEHDLNVTRAGNIILTAQLRKHKVELPTILGGITCC